MEEGEKGKQREGCVSHQLSKVQKRHPEKEPLLMLLLVTQSSDESNQKCSQNHRVKMIIASAILHV